MKKEYKTPVVKMIDLATESPLLDNSNDPGVNDGYDGGEALSNRRSIWGDPE